MESEDENFAWTDASSDSDNASLTMAITEQNGGDESESGYNYKKKIQNELFNNKHHIKEESVDMKKSKKRKHDDLDHTVTDEPKKKHIKLEPESDLDVHNKKRKSEVSDSGSILKEEEFLNLKVKEEQLVAECMSSKSKKKKKKARQRQGSHESTVCTSSLSESQSIVFENAQCENDAFVNTSEVSQEDEQVNIKEERLDTDSDRYKKKKLKKRKKKRHSTEETIIEEKFSAEETIVQQRTPKIGEILKKKEAYHSYHDTNVKSNEDSHNNSLTEYEHENSISMIESNNVSVDKGKSKNRIESNGQILSSNSSNDLSRKIPKIADRIRFEEDAMNFSQNEECTYKLDHSKQFKQFLKMNNHLKQISPTAQGDTIITDDDEVWVLKCPSEVNVNSLKDTNLVLDNKCKLKADSQTYVGFIENNIDNIAVLTLGQSKPIVKNVTLSGTVHFRKRIPKPHYNEHNIMENNQTNFIPLPETKHRHPLFGSNYKSAIKVPKSIAQRLNGNGLGSISDDNEKRKKKKKKHKQEVIVSDNEQNIVQEQEHIEVRKKRKRKHSHHDEAQSKSVKKLKCEPDSETWESEQAIEQQLFNF